MIVKNLQRFRRVVRRDGWRAATRKALAHGVGHAPAALLPKLNVFQHFDLILGEEQGFGLALSRENLPAGSMTWVIPDFEAQSGGHINILRMMRLLKARGFPDQHLVVLEPHRWSSAEEAQAALDRHFGAHGITVSLGAGSIPPSEYLVATGWQTAYWVAKYRDALHKLYFVQDFEPAFYPHGSEYFLAENTYRLGLAGITAGSWLADKLSAEYGMKTQAFSFACDTDLYKQTARRNNGTKHVFFYARPVTPRRCFEIGLLALKQVCEAVPEAAVIFAGWDVSGYEIPFPHLNAGTVPLNELPDLYSQCDVAVILSSTNLSLLPLEVAACGCPIVLNEGPQSEWLLSPTEAVYCPMSVDGVSEAVIKILRDQRHANRVSKAARKRAMKSDWSKEADKVAGFLREMQQ